MNNLRLLAGLACAALLSGVSRAHVPSVTTLEEIFASAEARSAQLRPSLAAMDEAERGISAAKAARLPDINASLTVSYIGDGFTTKRNFSDYQKAPIPHLGTGLSLGISQPVYAGGAITGAIDMAQLNSTAARLSSDLARDNLRIQLTGYYLDIYKYDNLRGVVEQNIRSARKVLAEMQARYDQGTALRNDITRYELLVSNLELRLVKLNNMLEVLNTNLATVAGLPDGTVVHPDSAILSQALPMQGENWWRQEALRESPALRLARYETLLGQEAVTRQQYDRAKADYDAARARYEMLSRQRRATSSAADVTRQRISQSDAAIELAQARLESALLNLSYTVIVAPCDGYTSRKEIQVGQRVQPCDCRKRSAPGREYHRIQSRCRICTPGQLVRHGEHSGPRSIHEGDIRLAVDCGARGAASYSRGLRLRAPLGYISHMELYAPGYQKISSGCSVLSFFGSLATTWR